MEDLRLIVDLVLALSAAFLGGMLAQRLGQPVLLGYILAGVLIGPNTPGLVADRDQVLLMANLGVAFLMFALGVEVSFGELQRVRRAALLGGAIQIPLTIMLGAAVGLAAGWSLRAALLLGGAFAISSSLVALKLLLGRGEVESPQGRVALGLGVVQDLSLIPMLAVLPVLSGDAIDPAVILRALATSAVALTAVIVVGTRVVPLLLYWVARTNSRELFLLTVVVIALGTGLASHAAGLSFALGAFLAGLVVSESEFDSQVLAEVVPLRDLFATLFFVALGMLVDPAFLLTHASLVIALIGVLVIGKLLITGGALLAAGVDHHTATVTAALMAQMGEFSFVLAGVGLASGIVDDDQYGLILATALGSIVLVVPLLATTPMLTAVAEHLPGVAAHERALAGAAPEHDTLTRHVVICGFGRVGAELGAALGRRGFSYTVIERNPAFPPPAWHRRLLRRCRRRSVARARGDRSRPHARHYHPRPRRCSRCHHACPTLESTDPRHYACFDGQRGEPSRSGGRRRRGATGVRGWPGIRPSSAALARCHQPGSRPRPYRPASGFLSTGGCVSRITAVAKTIECTRKRPEGSAAGQQATSLSAARLSRSHDESR